MVPVTGWLAGIGSSANGTRRTFSTIAKFSRAGTDLWRRTVTGALSGNDFAQAVVVDGQNDVTVAGRLVIFSNDTGRPQVAVEGCAPRQGQ